MLAVEQRNLLVVDDEELVVTSLKSLLTMEMPRSGAGLPLNVVGLTSPKAALDLIRRNPVDLVISDFLMPEMDGLAFLIEVRRLYPTASLIILTGYADKQSAIRAINEVGLFQYLEKPWDNDDLIRIVDSGLNQKLVVHRLQEYAREMEAKLELLTRQVATLKKQP
jgi:DNA-binding NtrC family response regulator